MKSAYLLYGKHRIEFNVPDHWSVLEPTDPPVIGNLAGEVDRALAHPIGTSPLAELARAADKARTAVIVISDITRPVPNRQFLPALLSVLNRAGFTDNRIVILVATGMHRPSTPTEHIELVGPDIARRIRIVDHRADDADTLVDLPGRTAAGTKVRIDRTYHEAGLKILTGFIEPHFMAGFSGGRKAVCPGLVDLRTLQIFHGYKFLADLRARVGNLEGNPLHLESQEVAKMARPDFLFNVSINAEGAVTGIFAGDLERAHAAGVEFVRRAMTVRMPQRFDLAFTSGGGYPLDTTFYQTVKGMVVASECVRPGGSVVVAAGCEQGLGSAAYRDLMFQYKDYRVFVRDIAADERTRLDQWEFQTQTRALDRVDGVKGLIMTCDAIGTDDLRRCHVTPAADLVGPGAAAQHLEALVRRFAECPRVAVLPRGPYLIPEFDAP